MRFGHAITGGGRKLLPLLFAIGAAALLIAVAGWDSWDAHWRGRQQRGRSYRIGVDHNPPNHDWAEGKGASGFAVEVMNEAARRSGIELQWVFCPRGSKAALQEGLIDIWPAGYYRPGEYLDMHQTRPWSEDQHVLSWDGGRFAAQPESWSGKRMAVMDRVATRRLANLQFPGSTLVLTPTRREALREVCAGTADVALLDMRVVESALLDRPEGCAGISLRIKPLPELADPMSIFSRLESAGGAEVLRDRIGEMIADGTVAKIAGRWFTFSGGYVRQAMLLQARARQFRWLVGLCVVMALVIGVLGWLVRKLRTARAAADRTRTLQAEFLANVSHEIRTPMNGILGTADLLLDTEEDPDVREQIQTIRESAYSQLELLNQILDQSKIDSGVFLLETTPFSPRKLAEQVEKTFLPAARRKGILMATVVEAGVPALVQGDGMRIRQVLSNLANNAIKFTAEGEVTIEVGARTEGALTELKFTVADTGIGIPAALQGTIFEKFRQVDASTTRRYGGTGLGLSISRDLVRLMGGELTVESAPGKGSRFTFSVTLPVARMVEAPSGAAAPGRLLTGMRVLVVEDNLVNQRVVQALLRRLGAQVSLAKDGREAVEQCREGAFDVVLMDCHMPEMDGYAATAEIRQLEGPARTVPIVALTAGVSGEERRKALAAGMDGFLAKPVNREELAAALAGLPRRTSSPR